MILKAAIKDAESIAKVGATAFEETHAHSASELEIKRYIVKKYSKEYLASQLANPKMIFNLFKQKGKLCGYSKLIVNCPYATIEVPALCKLEQLYFLNEYIGLGFGAELLMYNIDLSRKLSQKGMWLQVWTGNKRAILFYKKYDFKIIDEGLFPLSPMHSNSHYVMYLKY